MARTKNKRSKSQNRRSKFNNRKSKRVLRGGANQENSKTTNVIYADRPFLMKEIHDYANNSQANEGYSDGERSTIKISDWIQMFKVGLEYTPGDGGEYNLRVTSNYHKDGGLPEPTPPYLERLDLDKPVYRGDTLFRGDIINKVETHDGLDVINGRFTVLKAPSIEEYRGKLLLAPYIRFTLDKEKHNKLAGKFKEKYERVAIGYYKNKDIIEEINSLESLVKKLAQRILNLGFPGPESMKKLKEKFEKQIKEELRIKYLKSNPLHEFANIMKKLNEWKDEDLNDEQIQILIREGVIQSDSVAKNTLGNIEAPREKKKEYFQAKLDLFLERTDEYTPEELQEIINIKF